MSTPHLELDSTLGAAFLGNIFAAVLYGVTTLQTFVYFRGSYQDSRRFKLLILFLWVLDLVHLIFTTHGLYNYLITNYAHPIAYERPTWSLLSQVFITCLSDLIVRCVFARRVWILSERNHVLTILILTITAFVFATGVGFAARGFIDKSFSALMARSQWMLYSALGGGLVGDILVAGALCFFLFKNHTGFKRTDSMVNTLIIYSINTGLLTGICATACFITFALWPDKFVFMAIYFSLSKLYLNALLAVLNSRTMLRNSSMRRTADTTTGVFTTGNSSRDAEMEIKTMRISVCVTSSSESAQADNFKLGHSDGTISQPAYK